MMPANASAKPQRRSAAQKTSAPSFGQTPVNRQDVGEFASGYFIPSAPVPSPSPSKPPRKERKAVPPSPSQSRPSRPATSPPPKVAPPMMMMKHRSPSPKTAPSMPVIPTALVTKDAIVPLLDFTSPPPMYPEDKKLSPTSAARWAGPAFGNAPPPSALPMPCFDETPLSTSVPATSSPLPTAWETLVHAAAQPPPLPYYYAASFPPTAFVPPLTHNASDMTDSLRKMLNISSPSISRTPPTLVRA